MRGYPDYMPNRTPTLLAFMTKSDEEQFSQRLSALFPDVTFIDSGDWQEPVPQLKNSLSECGSSSPQHAIWNRSILDGSEYRKSYVFRVLGSNAHFGATVGPGLIQYLPSRMADYDPPCLRHGRLSASYDPKADPRTDQFVKTAFRVLKKGAKKVYLVDRATGKISQRPEAGLIALPDAAKRFNGENGRYLTHHAHAFFVAEP